MKAIVSMILLVLASFSIAKADGKSGHDKWYRCSKSKECIKVPAGCGRMESINKKFKSEQAKTIAKMAEKASCLEPNDEELSGDKEAAASCIEKKCELESTTSHAQK